MNELVVADRVSEWRRLKALVLDSVSSPITRRVYNLGLDEFIAWFAEAPRPAGFTKATVTASRVALEAHGSGLSRSTSGSRRSESWRSKLPTTGCWPRSWRRGSPGSRESGHTASVLATGCLS